MSDLSLSIYIRLGCVDMLSVSQLQLHTMICAQNLMQRCVVQLLQIFENLLSQLALLDLGKEAHQRAVQEPAYPAAAVASVGSVAEYICLISSSYCRHCS